MDGGSLEKERYYHNQGATITTRTLRSQPEGDYYNPGCDSSVLSGCANCVLVVLVNYQLCYKYLSTPPPSIMRCREIVMDYMELIK